jgi:hypothetical protein
MAIVPQVPGCTMGRAPPSPYVIRLGDTERVELESLSRRATAPLHESSTPHRAAITVRIDRRAYSPVLRQASLPPRHHHPPGGTAAGCTSSSANTGPKKLHGNRR